jgi:hypothetical protein
VGKGYDTSGKTETWRIEKPIGVKLGGNKSLLFRIEGNGRPIPAHQEPEPGRSRSSC